MKVFIGIILAMLGLALAGIVSAAPIEEEEGEENDYETCLKDMNEMTKDFVVAEPIKQLISSLEAVLDLQKVVELSLGYHSSNNTNAVRYAVATKNIPECAPLEDQYKEMLKKATCMRDMNWVVDGSIDRVMSGDFGRFTKAIYSCFITQKVDYPDEM